MDILIFSDSHGRGDGMARAFSAQRRRVDAVLFLGDGLRDLDGAEFGSASVVSVRGNCDWSLFSDGTPEECTLDLEGHRIFLTHGHRYGVKSGTGALLAHAIAAGADIVLFGHTHEAFSEVLPAGEKFGTLTLSRPLYLFNPGSVGYDGDGMGRSFGTLTLTPDTVLLSHGRLS